MVRIGLLGATGRMGRVIFQCLSKEGVVVCAYGRNPARLEALQALSCGLETDFQPSAEAVFRQADVVIDVSSVHQLEAHAALAQLFQKPLWVGVTGLQVEHKQALLSASLTVPIMEAPNGSLVVNALLMWLPKLARLCQDLLPDWHLIEKHHSEKVDAPSGTAKTIANALSIPEDAIVSIRAGNVPGEHVLSMAGPYEDLVISHRAWDRRTYAEGAIRSARWLSHQKAGLYTMQDFLLQNIGRNTLH